MLDGRDFKITIDLYKNQSALVRMKQENILRSVRQGCYLINIQNKYTETL